MYVDIYQSKNVAKKFVVIPSGFSLELQKLGNEATDFIEITPFIKEFRLDFGVIGLDAEKAKNNLLHQGFHIFL